MPLSSMNSRTRSRIPASIGSNQSSKRCEEVSVQSCVASSFVVTLGLAPGSEMARRRRDRWLLIRLAAQNVGRRRLRAIFLGVAVILGGLPLYWWTRSRALASVNDSRAH